MKLATFLIFAGTLAASATSYSQLVKIDLDSEDSTLFSYLGEIERETEFIFIYDATDINLSARKTISAKSENINVVLNKLFQGTEITYLINNRQIFLYRRDNPIIPAATKINLVKLNIPDEEQAQQKIISGKVTGSDNVSIPGVTVQVKGTTLGVLTSSDGSFTLPNVPASAGFLTFSFIGYKTIEVQIGNETFFNIILEEETVGLEEVVVVGYGTQKKESIVGAITQVDNTTLMMGGNINVSNAMAGKLSGVLAIQATGEPGKDQSELIIRGLSSWNSSAPLVLVDGVERDFNDLDPGEINTISVLKDASATAVFGAKGANGVIVVTTKRGSLGKPNLDFSTSYGLQRATKTYSFIDSYTTMNMLNVTSMNDQRFEEIIPDRILEEYRNPSTPLNALRYPSVDWYSELNKPFAPTYNANLSLRGGTNYVKYFTSIGYTSQGDFFEGYNEGYLDTRYKYNRYNYRSNLDFNLTESTLLSLTIGGDVDITNTPGTSPWKGIFQNSPARYPLYFPAWVLEQVPDTDYPDASGIRLADPVGEMGTNPYNDLHQGSFTKNLGATLYTDILIDQKLDFVLDGLSFKGKASLSTYYNSLILTSSYTFPQYQLNYDKIGIPGVNPWYRKGEGNEIYQEPLLNINTGGLNSGYYTDLYYEISLNYNNTFGKHDITGLALLNRQQKDRGTEFPYYNEALVGRATYSYAHKYLLELNLGYTGSERFAPGNRFGFFPSAAVGWVISQESFFKNSVPWMNILKLRYSDGLVGSDYANNRWLYVDDFWIDNGGYIHRSAVANQTAQWEQSRKRDIGLEIGVFKNLFTLNIDLFDDYRSKMLLAPQSVTFLVASQFKELNIGKMKKHGIELEAEFNKSTAKGLNYFIKGILGFSENRVIFKDDPIYAPEYTKAAGKPLDAQLNGTTVTGTGYYTTIDDIHRNSAPIDLTNLVTGDYKFLDYTADGRITVEDIFPIEGTTYPPITYSLSSGFAYKGFSLNMMFQGDWGKYVEYNQSFETEFFMGSWRVHKSQLDYWTPDNQDATHSTLHYSAALPIILNWGGGGNDDGYLYYLKDHFWRNASYLRLKELYCGYTFITEKLKPLFGLSSLSLFIQANNLLTFTPLIEGDPEKKQYLYNVGRSIYPQMTSLKLGVKLGF